MWKICNKIRYELKYEISDRKKIEYSIIVQGMDMGKFVPELIKRNVESNFIMYEYELYLESDDNTESFFCGILKFSDFNFDIFNNFVKENKDNWYIGF